MDKKTKNFRVPAERGPNGPHNWPKNPNFQTTTVSTLKLFYSIVLLYTILNQVTASYFFFFFFFFT